MSAGAGGGRAGQSEGTGVERGAPGAVKDVAKGMAASVVENTQNVLIRLAFQGTAYHGFQVQPNARTVCVVLQDAMERVFGQRSPVKGCSRTDAGVHARDFCLSFFAKTTLTPEKLPLALNAHLPADVRVFHAQAVPEDFHARYSATEKEYCYVFLNSPIEDAFIPQLAYRVAGQLDVPAMNKAARHLMGEHTFSSFMAGPPAQKSTVRNITKAQITRRGRHVVFVVAANGFLYNMVRILAGTLLAVGQGKVSADAMPGILEAQNRAAAGSTLPACGLYLNRVQYPGIAAPKSPQGPFVADLFGELEQINKT